MDPVSINNIFNTGTESFSHHCNQVYQFQLQHNTVYRQWCEAVRARPGTQDHLQLPFLPISFFKTHRVKTTYFQPSMVFESSGTTQAETSKHYIKDTAIYEKSFTAAFRLHYGDPGDYCIMGLLPSYLERNSSSLVYMVEKLMGLSGHERNGFYLYNHADLHRVLQELEEKQQPVVLFGVTYALLDYAEAFPGQLNYTTIIETGGMKGRKKELTRMEVHAVLEQRLGVKGVHSEYGMTELLSQAYAKEQGRFYCPPWMRVLVREEDDPLSVKAAGRGVLNIIDLANVYSCSFIATDDAGIVYEDGSFEVLGRVDNSDVRGCSLLVL